MKTSGVSQTTITVCLCCGLMAGCGRTSLTRLAPEDRRSPDAEAPDAGEGDGSTPLPDGGGPAHDAGPAPGSCDTDDDCDDSNPCNGMERCVDTLCVPGQPLECSDGLECTIDSCSPETGLCQFEPDHRRCADGELCLIPAGCVTVDCESDAACDDGLFCNGTERCAPDGRCHALEGPPCNDGLACTEDQCDEEADACRAELHHEICDNGLFCDGAEQCDPEQGCVAGAPVNCDDGDPCTADRCVEGEDICDLSPRDQDQDGHGDALCGGDDCNDLNRLIYPGRTESCRDARDNNCNELIDCDDPDCEDSPDCCWPSPEVCTDGLDNDCDGLPDCNDPDCHESPACQPCVPEGEVCDDVTDNDCDGLVDCEDPDCLDQPPCRPCEPELCGDGLDNDCDDLVDCRDPDCASSPSCNEPNDSCTRAKDISGGGTFSGSTATFADDYRPLQLSPSCRGGAGRDAVFFFDLETAAQVIIDTFGSDFDTVLYVRAQDCLAGEQVGCNDDTTGLQSLVVFDRLERGRYYVILDGYWRDEGGLYLLQLQIEPFAAENCVDGRDNDGDRRVDCDDPDCARHPSCACRPEPERGPAACADGRDNDCDGLIDCDDREDCSVVSEVGECCNGLDDNRNRVVDEFACRCERERDCSGLTSVCYVGTVGACGPPCNLLGGNLFCRFFFPGSVCEAASGRCEY